MQENSQEVLGMCYICKALPKPKKHDVNSDPQKLRRVARFDRITSAKGEPWLRVEVDCGCVFHFPASFFDSPRGDDMPEGQSTLDSSG